MREGSLHMKARLTYLVRAWLTVLALLSAAPVWAALPPTPPTGGARASDEGANASTAVTRLAWDRVGAPLQGLS